MTSYGTPSASRRSNTWEDWTNLFLGLWLIASPWVLQFNGATAAAWNVWILGAIVAALAAAALYQVQRWEEWVNALIGVWLVFSPWLLNFSSDQIPTWNAVILGILVLCAAGWELYTLPAEARLQH